MVGVFDGQHHIQQKVGHMGMALPDVTPGVPAELNGAPFRASDKKYHTDRR